MYNNLYPYDLVVVQERDLSRTPVIEKALAATRAAGKHCLLISNSDDNALTPGLFHSVLANSDGYMDANTSVCLIMHGDDSRIDTDEYGPNNLNPFLEAIIAYGVGKVNILSCHAGVAMATLSGESTASVIAFGGRKYPLYDIDTNPRIDHLIRNAGRLSRAEDAALCSFLSAETMYIGTTEKITAPKNHSHLSACYSDDRMNAHITANIQRIYAFFGEDTESDEYRNIIDTVQHGDGSIARHYRNSILSVNISRGHEARVYAVLAAGADPSASLDTFAPPEERYTPLSFAATFKNQSIVNALLEYGADVKQALNSSTLSLGKAAEHGHLSLVEAILAAGVDINAKNDAGKTPLHYAAAYEHYDIIRTLLSYGADPNAKDNDGKTPLSQAVDDMEEDTVHTLLESNAITLDTLNDALTICRFADIQEALEKKKALITSASWRTSVRTSHGGGRNR